MSDKLRLNIRTPTKDSASDEAAVTARIKDAAKRKKASEETIDEAWQRIFAMKNSATDNERLREVMMAMTAGTIGRSPADAGKRFSKAEALRLWRELQDKQRESKLREMVENTPSNYVLVTEIVALESVVEKASKEPIIAVDTETTGVDVYADVIVGISLTLPTYNEHYYIPCGHNEGEQLDRDVALETLRPVLENDSIGKVFHNAIFDIQMFKRHGVDLNGLAWDTQTAMHVLNENEPSFALKNLATKYLNEPSDTFDTLFGKDAQFADIPLDIALVYAAKDTDLTWRLYEFQRKHLSKMPTILEYYENVEVPLLNAIVDMERTGFLIDRDFAKQYGEEMSEEIDRLKSEIIAELGDINLNSPAQLKPALECVVGKKLDSTDAKKVLKPLAKDHDVIAKLLEYKELTKLYSTYISVLPELIHPKTGRLHGRFNPMGARTGRFSSGGTGVNLQNQPKRARKLFRAPEGYVIMGGDFSQQEVRCLAYMTQEPTLIKAYAEGKDVYATMASEVYGKPYEECGDGTFERKAMKVGVLSCMYGTGAPTLAQQLGISVTEAEQFIEDFFKRLPKVRKWIDDVKAFCKANGFVWMDKQQRKRRLPDATRKIKAWVTDRGESKRSVLRALRQGPNAVIQGTSAIQTKVTLVKLHELCKRKGWRLWATVHDEVLVLVPDTISREDVAEFESVMVNSYRFGNVPNKTDIELMTVWGEGLSVDEYFKGRE